jgi:hypothetical protein
MIKTPNTMRSQGLKSLLEARMASAAARKIGGLRRSSKKRKEFS